MRLCKSNWSRCSDLCEYKPPELQKKSLEELQKYGKNLSGFERTFVKFAGGTFEDMKKSIEDGGKLTQQGIVSTLGDNLSSDFDRLLTFLDPIGGLLTTNTILRNCLNLYWSIT